jgi:hypothetical protein
MTLTVREMMDSEVDLIIDYFQRSTPEHLETLGVDPSRLPPVEGWRDRLRREATLPAEQRAVVLGDLAVGRATGRFFDLR